MTIPRIWPGRGLATAILAPALLSLGILVSDSVKPAVIVFDLLVAAVALVDLLTLRSARRLLVERECERTFSLGEPQEVRLTVENPTGRAWRLRLRDDVPGVLSPEPSEFLVNLPARSRAELSYRLVPHQRGTYHLAQVDALVWSRLSFWQRALSWPVHTEILVYPDVRQIARYRMLARRNRTSAIGLRSSRRLGTDNEFERLRDYAEGDDPRHLDWRSTAKRRKLTVRAHQQNQSQRVIFLVDCGRMMAGDTGGGLSPLDHAFNAMLLLSHVALVRGDQVGLLAFADRTLAYLPPGGGARRIRQLVHAVHNVFPERVEPRYDRAFVELERRCRKRSLVVLLSNLFDEVTAQTLEDYLGNLRGRHLPLAVFLRDHDIFALADTGINQGQHHLYQAAAAADLLNWRSRVLAGLRRRGVLTLDVFSEDLTGELVSRYLEIKARHLL